MMNRIEIMSEVVILDEVKEFLEKQPQWSEAGINLELKKPNKKYRLSTDPTVLVAIVGALGVSLAALIKGLLEYAELKGRKGIRMQAQVGDETMILDVQTNTSFDEIEGEIEKYWEILEESKSRTAEKSDIEKIVIP